MTAKIKSVLWIALAVCVIVIAFVKLLQENRRLSDNFSAFAKETEYYKLNDSISAARSERLILEVADIKNYFPEIKQTIAQLEVKMKQLERYSAITSTANYKLANKVQDTLKIVQTFVQDRIIRDTLKLQYIQYRDKWIDFRQAILADSAYTSIQTNDSIAIVQSWTRPHKFLFLSWGRKKHVQTVMNANPHARITYSIYVEKK